MKKIFTTALALIVTLALLGQVKIEVPYQEGDVKISINVDYSGEISTSDSVRVEATFQGGFDPITEFTPVATLTNHPKTIALGYNFEQDAYGSQSYRCIVFQKGKAPVVSNEVTITYDPMNYSDQKLPKVENVQYKIIEKGDKQYIRLYWDAIPETLGYMVAKEVGGSYFGFQLYYDGPYSKTSNTYLDIPLKSFGTINYGVCGIQNPYDFKPETEALTLIAVDIPKK